MFFVVVRATSKGFDTRKQEEQIDVFVDHDEDKYKRRGIGNWLAQFGR